MPSNSRPKTALLLLLCASILATGCTAEWLNVALADLPVILQMALNIGNLTRTLQTGQQLSPAEIAAIQNISDEASRDLNLLKSLYDDYKTNPNDSTVEKIETTIAEINQNLPALLASAHIKDLGLSASISAAVTLILNTVNSFATLIPNLAAQPVAKAVRRNVAPPLHPQELKAQWNEKVCRTAAGGLFPDCEIK